ncbi:MAG: hypothetical protein AB1938_32810 [Myxococcota bacterium]
MTKASTAVEPSLSSSARTPVPATLRNFSDFTVAQRSWPSAVRTFT